MPLSSCTASGFGAAGLGAVFSGAVVIGVVVVGGGVVSGGGVAGVGDAGAVVDDREVAGAIMVDRADVEERVGAEDRRVADDGVAAGEVDVGTGMPDVGVLDVPGSSWTVRAASATGGMASSTVVFVQSLQGWNQTRPNVSAATITTAATEVAARWRRTNVRSPMGRG